MQTITEFALVRSERGVFTREEAAYWAGNRGASLDALLKRAVASREVLRLRRGLYCLAERYSRRRINPLDLAQQVHGPSYISMETALSQHGWIPEGVQAVTNASWGRSRTFETPVGRFRFVRVPQRLFLAGVRRISGDQPAGAFLMATPLKALADLVHVQRLDWQSTAPVVLSLRVDDRSLAELTNELFDEVLTAYNPGRARRFLTGIRRELKL